MTMNRSALTVGLSFLAVVACSSRDPHEPDPSASSTSHALGGQCSNVCPPGSHIASIVSDLSCGTNGRRFDCQSNVGSYRACGNTCATDHHIAAFYPGFADCGLADSQVACEPNYNGYTACGDTCAAGYQPFGNRSFSTFCCNLSLGQSIGGCDSPNQVSCVSIAGSGSSGGGTTSGGGSNTCAPAPWPTRFFFVNSTGYVLTGSQYCAVSSWAQWVAFGAPRAPYSCKNPSGYTVLGAEPNQFSKGPDCLLPADFFSSGGTRYHSDSSGHYCSYSSSAQYVAAGGPSSVLDYSPIPSSMVFDGVCGCNKVCPPSSCGTVPGCMGSLSCGDCPQGQVCTTANTCCTPTTCAALHVTCGTVGDGCGHAITCGPPCPPCEVTCNPGDDLVCGDYNGCNLFCYSSQAPVMDPACPAINGGSAIVHVAQPPPAPTQPPIGGPYQGSCDPGFVDCNANGFGTGCQPGTQPDYNTCF